MKACQYSKISCIEKSLNCSLREHHEEAFSCANLYLLDQEETLL